MQHQWFRPTIGFGFGLVMVFLLGGCLPSSTQSSQAAHSLAAMSNANAKRQALFESCQQESSGWALVRNFETAHYSLSLCRKGNTLHLLGQQKSLKKFIVALAQVDQQTIVAEGNDRFSYEIRQGTLTVKKRGNIVVQEGVK